MFASEWPNASHRPLLTVHFSLNEDPSEPTEDDSDSGSADDSSDTASLQGEEGSDLDNPDQGAWDQLSISGDDCGCGAPATHSSVPWSWLIVLGLATSRRFRRINATSAIQPKT